LRVLRNVDDDFWLAVAAKSESATFFHTPQWSALVTSSHAGCRDVSVGALLRDGVRVVLPLLDRGRSGRGLFHHLVSGFAGCYGGLIADGPVAPDRQPELYAALLSTRRVDSLQLTENPLAASPVLPPHFRARPEATQLLALDAGWPAVAGEFSRGNRGNIRRGRARGVVTRLAATLDDYRAYYALYERSLARWGARATSRYPWGLFENGYQLGLRSPETQRLWLAEADDRVMAGAWVFYWNGHAVYWHGATDVRFAAQRPANVLHADIIRDACEREYRWYDFSPSGGHEGVARFKAGFGCTTRPLRVWSYRSTRAAVVDAARGLLGPDRSG
jgi:hypothetical protein